MNPFELLSERLSQCDRAAHSGRSRPIPTPRSSHTSSPTGLALDGATATARPRLCLDASMQRWAFRIFAAVAAEPLRDLSLRDSKRLKESQGLPLGTKPCGTRARHTARPPSPWSIFALWRCSQDPSTLASGGSRRASQGLHMGPPLTFWMSGVTKAIEPQLSAATISLL